MAGMGGRGAAATLGDGSRYPEIYALNKGRGEPGGGAFTSPGVIQPGQVLEMPADAQGPGVQVLPAGPPGSSSSGGSGGGNGGGGGLIQMAPLALLPISASSSAAEQALRVRFAATPWMAETFGTNNAASVAAADKSDAALKQDMVGVAMTQGLINQGVISPPGGQQPHQPLPGNAFNSKLLEDWWIEYGYRMGLANSINGQWDSGGPAGSGSQPAG
jgi:hypothetical protein